MYYIGAITRTFTVISKELLHLRRDIRSLSLLLILPTISIVVLNYAFGEVNNIPICVSNQDGGEAADVLISSLREEQRFKVLIEGNYTDEDSRRFILYRMVKISMVIPPGFTENIENHEEAHVRVMIDATDQTMYLFMAQGIAQVIQKTLEKLLEKGAGYGEIEQRIFNLEIDKVYGGDLRFIDQMAPIMIAFFLTYISISVTTLSVIREKVEGTLERMLLTPIRGAEVVIGKLLAAVLVAVGETFLLLLIGVQIFNIRVVGDIFLVFSLGLLIALGGLGMGLAFSSVSKKEVEAMLWQVAYIVPSMLMSGLMWPIEAMPPVLQTLANLVPMTHAIRALRVVMVGGLGVGAIILEISVLTIFAIVMLSLGVLTFRREIVTRI